MQILINGLIAGCAIALLALSFQAVYLPTKVFFLGLAGIYSLAPFIALSAKAAGLPLAAGVGVTVLASILIALAMEWFNHGPLSRRHATQGTHLIASLGLYIVVTQASVMIWGSDTKTLRSGLNSTMHFHGIMLTDAQLFTAVATALLGGVFFCFLRLTNLGLSLRALADNPAMFALYGYNVGRYRLLSFALSGVLAAFAALSTAYDIGFDSHSGLHGVLLAVVAVIIGGQGSFAGPFVGALLVGVLREQVVWHASARWQESATFGLLAVFLLFRPQGLFGRKARLEASC